MITPGFNGFASAMRMTLRQIATKAALVVETVLIVLVATAVIPLCLAVLGWQIAL
jgi:hypothetical protein